MDMTILYVETKTKEKKTLLQKMKEQVQKKPQIEIEEAMYGFTLFVLEGEWEVTKDYLEVVKSKLEKKHKIFLLMWYSPKISEMLGENNNSYPLEFLFFIYEQFTRVEAVYIKEDGQEEILDFAEHIYDECNKMLIWIAKTEIFDQRSDEWNALAEHIYENSGLAIEVVEELPQLLSFEKEKWKPKLKTIFFDFSKAKEVSFRRIPKEAIYIDFYPNKQKRKVLIKKRSDLTYLTYANFLDEKPKIRYNTEVTKTSCKTEK